MIPLKIGFFYVPYYPLGTGRSVHGFKLVEALTRRGHQVLSCLGEGNPACIPFERSRAGAVRLAREADVLYIRVAGRPVHSFLEKATLLKLLRPFSLPVVWEVNAPVEELRASFPEGPRSEALIRSENRKRKFLSRFVDAGIGVSQVMKDYIKTVLKINKSYSIPNASDPDLFDPATIRKTVLSQLQGKFIVFWMGNAGTPWQGIDLILEVARRVETVDPEILFVLVTGDSLWEFPVLTNLLVLREIPYGSLPHYLAAADLCLCLYREYDWLSCGFYGSALKLFDFMAAGKAVIASRMGQLAEVIEDSVNGRLVDNSCEAVVNAIRELKGNGERRRLLGTNARAEVIRYYNWDRVARETEAVLLDVCTP